MNANMRRQLAPPNVLMLASCGAALATLVPVALRQTGLLKHLPDPPSGFFASDAITRSKAAHPLGVPDSLLGLASYAATFALMLAARDNRSARHLLRYKLAADGTLAAFNTVRQILQFRRICSWCTGTAAATALMLFAGRELLLSSIDKGSKQLLASKCL